MVQIRQTVVLEDTEAAALTDALAGRVIDLPLKEFRAHFNEPARLPGDGETARTVLTQLRAGQEITAETVHHVTDALTTRIRLLRALVELLGEDAADTRTVLDLHNRADAVVRQVAEQVGLS